MFATRSITDATQIRIGLQQLKQEFFSDNLSKLVRERKCILKDFFVMVAMVATKSITNAWLCHSRDWSLTVTNGFVTTPFSIHDSYSNSRTHAADNFHDLIFPFG